MVMIRYSDIDGIYPVTFLLSNSRQSEYVRAPGTASEAFFRLLASTSQMATICTFGSSLNF